jgi:glycosyltransferase involved in cell wall biosynthesis
MSAPGERIAYVVVMFPCYSETFVLREIRELVRRGAEIAILSLRGFSEKIIDEDARPLLARTIYSPFLFSRALLRANLAFLLRSPRRYLGAAAFLAARLWRSPVEFAKTAALFPKAALFARLLSDRGVAHIHAHFANYPATAALVISRLSGIPFTFTAHAHDIFQGQLLLAAKVAAAERVFAISRFNRRFILERCGEGAGDKVEVLHCGLDLGRLPRKAAGEIGGRTILAVGRLMAIKGFDTLIRAAGIARDRGAGFDCVIVGDGPDRGDLERLVEGLGLSGTVSMEGERTPQEVVEMMARARIFALPSRPARRRSGVMDGIPVSLMEAMAIGVPVVSCPVSGIPELVEDGRTGLLVPPADPVRLADALERLLGDAGLCARLAEAARKKVEREFDIARVADRLVEAFAGCGAPIRFKPM